MSKPLWKPSSTQIEHSQIYQLMQQVNDAYNLKLSTYSQLHQWSVSSSALFWDAVWDHCRVVFSKKGNKVLKDANKMPGAQWFPDARLNFAENLMQFRDNQPALICYNEHGHHQTLTYQQLYQQTSQMALALRHFGIQKGDRIVGYMPNITETVITMLACTSIGAIWSSCSPDFGIQGVINRFQQIKPRILITADGYCYNRKTVNSLDRIREVSRHIRSLEKVIIVPYIQEDPDIHGLPNGELFRSFSKLPAKDIQFEQLPFNHPLYILYSSGTTGTPKCIVHSAGGTLLQHLKEHKLHLDLQRNDCLFYYTTCGWMMWNWLVSGLASGCRIILYDGAPFSPSPNTLWDIAEREKITVFGTSAKYLSALQKAGRRPRTSHYLKSLRALLSTGSPLSADGFHYVYQEIKRDLMLSSLSGGTDIISCFALGCPMLPVYAGELQCKGLGMATDIYNDMGKPVTEEKGELVCTQPFPSMPLGFWNDPNGSRYHNAYFARFPNVWAHGDYGEITAHEGLIIHGRSDAVLNPGGVRIGTSEIYQQAERIDAVQESICIGQPWHGDVRVILFVRLKDGLCLDDKLTTEIKTVIRENTTPRHVPDKIIQVADIPCTISGKIVELAVRKIVMGEEVKNMDALANPGALELYKNLPELLT